MATSRPDGDTLQGGPDRHFPSTCWSLFLGDTLRRTEAAGELARRYWKPIYACIRTTWAATNEDAKDLTQDFFIWMMETDFLGKADPARGRFRAFVKVALKRYLSNEARKEGRIKRGGDRRTFALDGAPEGIRLPDAKGKTPEEVLDEAWKNELLLAAATQLQRTLKEEGNEVYFHVFREYFLDQAEVAHRDVARRHGIREGDVSNYLRRAKQRYRDILRELIAETVGNEGELRDEWEALFGGLK